MTAGTPVKQSGEDEGRSGFRLSYVSRRNEDIVILLDEVVDARRYWSVSLIGYVLGDQVPFSVMKAFVDRNWKTGKGYYTQGYIFMRRAIMCFVLLMKVID